MVPSLAVVVPSLEVDAELRAYSKLKVQQLPLLVLPVEVVAEVVAGVAVVEYP